MPRYLIVRQFHVGEDKMPDVGRRSRQIVDDLGIVWEHSHVVVDDTGEVKTFCVYAAPNEELIQRHAEQLGGHEVEVLAEIAGDVSPADFPLSD
jgi:Protein of unknown function (DUF4242)